MLRTLALLCVFMLPAQIMAADFPLGYPDAPQTEVVTKREQTVFTKTLLWLPNRVADLIDIFRIDVGVGPSTGFVLRISEHFQAGYRNQHPAALRLGLFGRDNLPFILERSSEFGVSPLYVESRDREICNAEIGAGVDVILVGAYAGICLQEIADFFGGLFMYDLSNDDF